MGLEANVVATYVRKSYEGKLHVDSKCISFRAKDFKWEAALGESIKAEADDGVLKIVSDRRKISFTIGDSASKWVDKVLNPPSRMKKFGVKEMHRVWVSKGFDKSFKDEIKSVGAKITRIIDNCDLAICIIKHRGMLPELDEYVEQLPEKKNIWVVWPKGSSDVGQTDVMQHAKSLGMGPSKTAAFDGNHSSMRFAIKK